MKILVAPNAFKGALTASLAARCIARGIYGAAPEADIDLMPISDGGDGLMEVLIGRWGGRRIWKKVSDPLDRPVRAYYVLSRDGQTGVVEMAQASGMARLRRSELDALGAWSYGTGELIRDALDRGASRIIVGMGGSATNDAGAGMAAALGASLLDSSGAPLRRGTAALLGLDRIRLDRLHPRVSKTEFIAVSDVVNPLLGPQGSARVYGPQKGATAEQVKIIDRALIRYAAVLKRDLGKDVAHLPGSGAAGGLGTGLTAFLNARIVEGAPWVLDALDADRRLEKADWAITGEGRFDSQSFFGKAPFELARRAFRKGIRAAVLCGQLEKGLAGRLKKIGSPEVVVLSRWNEEVESSMKETGPRLVQAARRALEDFLAFQSEAAN